MALRSQAKSDHGVELVSVVEPEQGAGVGIIAEGAMGNAGAHFDSKPVIARPGQGSQ